MKGKKEINIAKHIPTGAMVPVNVNKVNDKNEIEKFKEHLHNRKGFKLSMLQNRWDKTKEDVIELLNRYQVPGHLNHAEVKSLGLGETPMDIAVFFEEYIYGLENMEKLSHNKLKAKCFYFQKEH